METRLNSPDGGGRPLTSLMNERALSSKVSRAELLLATVRSHLRRLLYGALVILLIVLAAALSTALVPRLFSYGTLVVSGGSMSETVPNGSLVIGRWITASEVEPGDVILVQEATDDGPARPRIHRVVSLDEEGGQLLVRTKGDANPTVDPNLYVLPDRVLTPASTLPYLGYIVGLVQTPLGWALAVALPAMFLCATSLWEIWGPAAKDAKGQGPWAG